jgi:hypothetical protein
VVGPITTSLVVAHKYRVVHIINILHEEIGMFTWKIILFLMIINSSKTQITKNNAFQFKAYDCRKPKSLNSYRKSEWCSPKQKNVNQMGDKNEKNVILVQNLNSQKLKAIRCEKVISSFSLYCGAYSHMKFASPPTILQPEEMTPEECSDMYRRRAFIFNGQTYRIGVNQQIQIPMIKHGQLYATENNVQCDGAKFVINGEEHSNMLELLRVQITMRETTIQVSKNGITDTQTNIELEKNCLESLRCKIGMATYLLLEKSKECQLVQIRTIPVNSTTLVHDGQPTEYLVNDQHKLLIRTTNKEENKECGITMYSTNYPRLKLIKITENQPDILDNLSLHPEGVDLDLEIRMSEEFINYRLETLMHNQNTEIQQHLCALGTENIVHMERSPIHPDALIRIRGDIIQELRCNEVLVTATTGYQRNQECYRDHLPVYLGDEPVYLDTSRLITTNPIMDQVDCKELFPPIFQSITGQLVQATPKVQTVQIQLSKPEQLGYHVDTLEHVEETDSLLYTRKEIRAYNELFLAQRSMKALSYSMTSRYCSASGSCGLYRPTGPGLFDIDNLTQNALKILDWKEQIRVVVTTYGNYASIIVLIYLIWKLMYTIINTIRTRRKGVTWATAIRLNTLLLSEFREHLIQDLPPRQPTPSLNDNAVVDERSRELVPLGPLPA